MFLSGAGDHYFQITIQIGAQRGGMRQTVLGAPRLPRATDKQSRHDWRAILGRCSSGSSWRGTRPGHRRARGIPSRRSSPAALAPAGRRRDASTRSSTASRAVAAPVRLALPPLLLRRVRGAKVGGDCYCEMPQDSIAIVVGALRSPRICIIAVRAHGRISALSGGAAMHSAASAIVDRGVNSNEQRQQSLV